MRSCILVVAALSLVAAGAQEKDKPSKPQDKDKPAAKKGELKPGDELPGPFQPYNVNGRFNGRFHCLVCERGLNPTVAVFVRGTDDLEGVSALLQGLEATLKTKKNEKARLGAFAVFVDEQLPDVVANDEKRDEVSKKLEDVAAKLDRVAVGMESKTNLEKYKLDPDVEVTLILYDKLKVVEVKKEAKGKLTKESVPALVNEVVTRLVGKP
jgi:hypothetical protein